MNKNSSNDREKSVQKEKRINGLIYGLIAGLAFALAAWGYDTIVMVHADVQFSWAKLALSIPICMLIGGIAGRLSAQFDNGLVTVGIWLLAGVAFAYIASHLPFDGMSMVLGMLVPPFRGLNVFPFVYSALIRMNLLYVVVGFLSILVGLLESFAIESAISATYIVNRFFYLSICVPIFVIAGLAVDDLINVPLRTPFAAIDDLIRFGQYANTHEVSNQEVRDSHLRALDPIKDHLSENRKLILGEYDPESFSEVGIIVNLGNTWARCITIAGSPSNCKLLEPYYLTKLACLLSGGNENYCGIQLSDSAREQFPSFSKQLNPDSTGEFLGQYGTTALVNLKLDNNEILTCRIQATSDITLEGCEPGPASRLVRTPSTPFPLGRILTPLPTSRTPTPTITPEPFIEGKNLPESPILPAAEAYLPDITTSPVYSITVNVDYDARLLQAHQVITYTNAENVTLNEIYLHLLPNSDGSYGNGSLNVSQVTVKGQPAETQLSTEDSILKVSLPEGLQPGEKTTLQMIFDGAIPIGFGGDASPAGYGIYNLSDGVMALADWYPILAVYDQQGWHLDPASDLGDSVYADTAFYNVNLTVPADLVVATTGVTVSEEPSAGSTRYQISGGPAREFFMVMSPDFKIATEQVNGTQVNSYYLPNHATGGMKAASVAKDALDTFNQQFGAYPYTQFDVVDAPMRNALGVEFPGIVMIGDQLYDSPEDPAFDVTVAHEVAHQWWYNTVGNDVFNEPWLDEALATFSSGVYFEKENGRVGYDILTSRWTDRYQQSVDEGKDDLVTETLAHFESLDDPRVYGSIVYNKGALFFVNLRKEIGDEAFFKGLKDYYQAHYFQIARASDLLTSFEQAAGRQLDDFYNQWLYSKK